MNRVKRVLMIVTVAMWVFSGVDVSAQTGRNVAYKVSVGDISYTKKEPKTDMVSVFNAIGNAMLTGQVSEQLDTYIDAVRANVVKGLGNVRRFRTIDGSFNPGEIDGEQAYYVDGTIANIATTSKTASPPDKNTKAKTYYKALISLTLNLKDAHTDEIVSSQAFSLSEYEASWEETAEVAVNKALEKLSTKITTYYNKAFPQTASIVERNEVKSNKVKEVYIDLGAAEGAFEGMHFNVYSIKKIAGREARKELGRIRISEVSGDDISLCKVQRGGKDINAAIEAGETVIIVSME